MAVSVRELIAAGFSELERSGRFLGDEQLDGLDPQLMLRTLSAAPNPDQALLLLIRLIERAPQVRELFHRTGDERYPDATGLVRLLGTSQALGEFLIRHPEQTDLLLTPAHLGSAEELTEAFMAAAAQAHGDAGQAATRLRTAYRRELTALALEDLAAADPAQFQPFAAQQLAHLADAAVEAALQISRAERRRTSPGVDEVELTVIGLGKCGAQELNYISDVDVVFVHRAPEQMDDAEARNHAVALASGISQVLGASSGEPPLWEIDANLRPEGKDGALSRTLDSHVEYYKRWAHGWEFQALLKARSMAGSADLGADYMAAIGPMVWQSSTREGFVEDVQGMRHRVLENIPRRYADREIKLGRGGLRDIEFTVQLLQLVHGRTDESLRSRDTLSAVAALAAGEYMSSADADAMSRCYRQLRLYEHRIQLQNMRRTHLMPERESELRPLAHAVRAAGEPRRAPDDLLEQWRRIKREVAGFHERIFYRPLLSTTAVLADGEVRLTPDTVTQRLAALGYRDASAAVRHLQALTTGISRRATLQRRILPAMLGWFAEGVDPDRGLLAFRRLSESLGISPWYLSMLRDSNVAAERLCYLLSSSRFISDMLEHLPELTRWLGDDAELAPRSFDSLWTEVQNAVARHEGEPGTGVRLARLVRQRETLRIAIADAVGLLDSETVGRSLAEIDRVATLGALRVAEEEILAGADRYCEFLVVAMGRQGGREIGYGSDMDAIFVHRAVPGVNSAEADAQAQKLAARVTALLSKPVKPAVRGEFPLVVDANLRPEGKQGALSRSLDSFAEYYTRWMEVWERQALLRARPIAGSDGLAADFMNLVDSVRYGPPPSAAQVQQIRRIKARVEAERLPRGADPTRQVKLGRGGLSDVEWLIQLLQLQHAHRHQVLRSTSTLPALNALIDVGLISPDDANTLAGAWSLCTRVRAAGVISTGKVSDVLPSARRELEAVSRWCGFGRGRAAAFEEHYLRCTRRARQVYERLFYED